uniref:Uncharacterized protein n=1 Tax=Panagrolaimus sp. ES5 TaxID=591445 RepID=A0AC34GJG5_9BILA
MVNNAASEQKCVCCDTPKEGGSGNAAPQPAFKPTQFKPVSSSEESSSDESSEEEEEESDKEVEPISTKAINS